MKFLFHDRIQEGDFSVRILARVGTMMLAIACRPTSEEFLR